MSIGRVAKLSAISGPGDAGDYKYNSSLISKYECSIANPPLQIDVILLPEYTR